MGESSVKSFLGQKKAQTRVEEKKTVKVDSKTFLSGVHKVEPVSIKGYVCLF
jgi:predicted component of type VI protein secretion system